MEGLNESGSTAQAESGRIQHLLDEIRDLAPAPAWERVEELVRRLLALYGEGLSRTLDHAHACGADGAFDQRLGADELVSSLLLLHGLHPLPTRDRVLRAVEQLRAHLEPRGGRAEVVAVDGAVARLRFAGSQALEALLRRAVEDAAPELQRVDIETFAGPLVALRIGGNAR
jgi:hypothetical protein